MSIRFLEVKRAYYANPMGVTVQWRYIGDEQWMDVIGEPDWGGAEEAGIEFRIKVPTLRIGNKVVNVGIRSLPTHGVYVYIADPCMDSLFQKVNVNKTTSYFVQSRIERGLVHLSESDAVLHASALIEVSVNG